MVNKVLRLNLPKYLLAESLTSGPKRRVKGLLCGLTGLRRAVSLTGGVLMSVGANKIKKMAARAAGLGFEPETCACTVRV